MRGRLVALATVVIVLAVVPAARAEPAAIKDPPAVHKASPPADHDNPRLKASFRQLWIANLDGSRLPLHGAQLDVYPLSRRWARIGIAFEGGAGAATLEAHEATLWYALTGLALGLQYPARVTPFVDGRFAFGVLGGHLAQAVAVSPNLSLANASAVTYLLTGGIDVGVEVYVAGRTYLSLAVGWVHPIYRGVDYAALKAGSLQQKDIASDAFTFKLGFGI
jgi:hypothetical protein